MEKEWNGDVPSTGKSSNWSSSSRAAAGFWGDLSGGGGEVVVVVGAFVVGAVEEDMVGGVLLGGWIGRLGEVVEWSGSW